MPSKRILYRALCLEGTVLKSARREGGAIVLTVSPRRGQKRRRPFCARRSPVYDRSRRPRRWRAPDLGSSATYLEYIELEGPEAAPTLIAEELVLQVPEETLDACVVETVVLPPILSALRLGALCFQMQC